MKKLIFCLMLVGILGVSVQAMTVTKPGLSDHWSTLGDIGAQVMMASTTTPATSGTSRNNVASNQPCLSNTFTIAAGETNLRLQAISFWGDGGDSAVVYKSHFRLLDLGLIATTPYPTPASYNAQMGGISVDPVTGIITDPANLININNAVWTTYGLSPKQVVNLGFTDETVMLTAGHTYVIEDCLFGGIPNQTDDVGGGFYFERFNPAGFGAIYSSTGSVADDRALKSGYGRCDEMAVYLCPEPTTIALLCIGGLSLLRKKR